jgi:hypothetical protein
MSLKIFIVEKRKENAVYQEEKAKGLVTKAILGLEGSEAGTATKLARRLHNTSIALKKLATSKAELEDKLRGMVEGVFDEANDLLITRVISTATFIITMNKKTEPKERVEINHDKIMEGLLELLDKELKPQIDELIKANTRKWTPEAGKSAIAVKPLEEGVIDAAKGALATMLSKLQDFAAALKKKVTSWGKAYDAKLDELKIELKGKPVIEAKVAGKFTKFITEAALSDQEKKEIIKDFQEWSGGFTPDECPTYPDTEDKDGTDTSHETYIENTLSTKFAPRKEVVREFLEDYKPINEAAANLNRPGFLYYDATKVKACASKIDTDSIKAFDALVKGGGHLTVLDARPYAALLDELKITYTFG